MPQNKRNYNVVLPQQSLDFHKDDEFFFKLQFCSHSVLGTLIFSSIFHYMHCDGMKNIKSINAQHAKQSVPVEEYQKRLHKTNT